MSGSSDLKIIIGLALVCAVGLLLNIIACVRADNWWLITVVIAYVFAPLPNMLCGNMDGGGVSFDGHDSRGFKDASMFLTGFLVISGFAIPIVLVHTGVIAGSAGIEALLLGIAGGIMVYGAVIAYLKIFHGKSESTF